MFDYKKIIKNRNTRNRILSLFNWLPDKEMLKLQYFIKFGRKLNFNNLKRLTEKIQWYKLYYHDPLMNICADKYRVREYINKNNLNSILNELYAVYDDADKIDFSELPNRFVMKCTFGVASQQVKIVLNKKEEDLERLRNVAKEWLKNGIVLKNSGREWAYNNIKKRIIFEKYIDSSNCKNGLISYKIFCFNGKPSFVYLVADVKEGYFDADYGVYNINLNKINCERVGATHLKLNQEKPANWSEMLKIAEKLSKPFPHVRVDLYNVEGKILFGELTFYNDSGYMKYNPDKYDYIFGNMFDIESIRKNKNEN